MLPTDKNKVPPLRLKTLRFVARRKGTRFFVRDLVGGVVHEVTSKEEAVETAKLMNRAYIAHRGERWAYLIETTGRMSSDIVEIVRGGATTRFNVTRTCTVTHVEFFYPGNPDNVTRVRLKDMWVTAGDQVEIAFTGSAG